MRVASAVGEGRGFADAFRVGEGATAHLLPISPGIAGLVYMLFGVSTPAAEVVLFCWSVGLLMAGLLLLYRAFGRLGVPTWARLTALGYACLAPAYLGQESVEFRVWDGGLTAFLGALLLDRIIAAELAPAIGAKTAVTLAALGALLFFVNPPAGVAYLICAAVVVLRRLPVAQWWAPILTGALVLVALVGPWALRNERVLGEPVALRSNAGLELAIGLYPGALNPPDREREFMARLEAVHPAVGDKPYEAMKAAGGEIAYARELGARTRAWVWSNPMETAALMLLHIRQTVAPQPWQFAVFGSGEGVRLRAALTQVPGILGLIGLAVALARRRRGWWCPALVIGVILVLGSPFQPVKRYTYLVYPILVFAAGSLLDEAQRWRTRRRPGERTA